MSEQASHDAFTDADQCPPTSLLLLHIVPHHTLLLQSAGAQRLF